eukprot:12087058-Prorocentrum_lima.AAC.1
MANLDLVRDVEHLDLRVDLLLPLAGDSLARHDSTVAIHTGPAGEALPEDVADHWLLGLEAAMCRL